MRNKCKIEIKIIYLCPLESRTLKIIDDKMTINYFNFVAMLGNPVKVICETSSPCTFSCDALHSISNNTIVCIRRTVTIYHTENAYDKCTSFRIQICDHNHM